MNAVASPLQRSTFVTVLAWIFIVLSGFATFVSLMQNVMVFSIFQAPEFTDAMDKANRAPNAPPFAAFFTRYFFVFFVFIFLMSAATLASSIGLLWRRNWARIVFIVLMAFGIFWNLVGLAITGAIMWFMPGIPTGIHPAAATFAWMMGAMMVFNVVIALGFCALFFWIIRRLRSPEIRAEFGVAA